MLIKFLQVFSKQFVIFSILQTYSCVKGIEVDELYM